MKYLYLFLSVVFNVASYFVYKSIAGKEETFVWFLILLAGLLLGAVNVYFFTKALKDIPLSISYPVFSGGCIFFMILFSHLFFGERMGPANMIGAVVIIAGIALMTY